MACEMMGAVATESKSPNGCRRKAPSSGELPELGEDRAFFFALGEADSTPVRLCKSQPYCANLRWP